jgi:transposase
VAGEQSEAFRKRIEIVVIDPSAPYASGIRAILPDAKLAVDIWHLVALANQMVTEARQRATPRQTPGEPARRRHAVHESDRPAPPRDARPDAPNPANSTQVGGSDRSAGRRTV